MRWQPRLTELHHRTLFLRGRHFACMPQMGLHDRQHLVRQRLDIGVLGLCLCLLQQLLGSLKDSNRSMPTLRLIEGSSAMSEPSFGKLKTCIRTSSSRALMSAHQVVLP